ncbi:helix-turn-helix domain-containing protein [Embleya sp. NPDC059237]|uniref:helix-turn-helix domain-containing protein n=1 Tax=Embleya sp. NPDC059237 TaxID=3346784 RepID=UPI0036859670
MDSSPRHPLSLVRAERGWSLEDLAREVRDAAARRGLRSGTRRGRVWKWESGVEPCAESQLLLAEALGVDPADVDVLAWPHWLPGLQAPLPLGAHHTVTALREALKTTMKRRTLLGYTGTALAGLAAQWAVLEPPAVAGSRPGAAVDAEFVEWLETTAAQLSGLATVRPRHTAALLEAHLETVTTLITDAGHTPRVGRRLHLLAASLSQTIAWVRFDQGEHAVAGRFWHAGLHSAHAGADHDLGAGILSDLAYQATWTGDPKSAVGILEHALTRTGHPAARSLLHLRKARAHAALREARACRRALACSEHELAATRPDPAPAWCSWMGEADLAVDSGQCLLDLGDHLQALHLIDEGLDTLQRPRDKTRGVFLTYRAQACVREGQIDRAAAAATEALTLARRIGAPRCVALVRELAPAFALHRTVEGVPELLDLVRAT